MDDFTHAKNDDFSNMTILAEILNEHALSVDFAMFILIWMGSNNSLSNFS